MSHLTYYHYKGWGETAKQNLWYSQAVRIGDRIECSGQGGWDTTGKTISTDFATEVHQAFLNCETNLRDAGAKGWENVYSVKIYTIPMTEETLAIFVANLKMFCPHHQPIWTLIGVTKLGKEDMNVEVEVLAHVPS